VSLLAAVMISASIVTLLATFAPVVVDVLARDGSSARFKSIMLIVIVAVMELVEGAVDSEGVAVLSGEQLGQFAFSLAVAVVAFFTGWKPTGVSDTVQAKTARFGLGAASES